MNILRRASAASFLRLETPNAVRSVALQSWNIQATSKVSDKTARMPLLVAHTTLLEIFSRGSYVYAKILP